MVSPIQPGKVEAYNPFSGKKVEGAINQGPKGNQSAGIQSGKLNILHDLDTSKTYKIKVGRFSALLKPSEDFRLPQNQSEDAGTHMIDLSNLDTSKLESGEDFAKALEGRIAGFSVKEGSGRAADQQKTTQTRSAPTTDTSSSRVDKKADGQTAPTSRLNGKRLRALSQEDTSKFESALNRSTKKARTNSDQLGRLSNKAQETKETHEKNKAVLKELEHQFKEAEADFTKALDTGDSDTIAAAETRVNTAFANLERKKADTSESRQARNTAQVALSKEQGIQRQERRQATMDSMRAKVQSTRTNLNSGFAKINAGLGDARKFVGSKIKSMTASSNSSTQERSAGQARRGQALWNGIQTLSQKATSGIGSIASRISNNLPRNKPNLQQQMLTEITELRKQVAELLESRIPNSTSTREVV